MKKLTLLLSGLLLSSTAFAHNGLHYNDPYARATPPNAVNSAIFMTIENHMDSERTLVAAQTDVASKTELHTVEKDGDLMKMRKIDHLNLPAHGQVILEPGSYHLMLLNVKQPLIEGDNLTLTLQYANGETETLNVPVKKVMAGMSHKSDHSSH